jgi:hypothetical protein
MKKMERRYLDGRRGVAAVAARGRGKTAMKEEDGMMLFRIFFYFLFYYNKYFILPNKS